MDQFSFLWWIRTIIYTEKIDDRVYIHITETSLKTQNCLDDVHADFSKLLKTLNQAGTPYSLSVANRLYGEQSYHFVEDFLGETRKHCNVELESVDFKTCHEAERLNINKWVEKQTQGKIKNVLAHGVVDNMTRLVLVNAIYFKGNWNNRFNESDTKDAQFRINKDGITSKEDSRNSRVIQ